MKMVKVVQPQEIVRVERLACAEGCVEEKFMEEAGQGVASRIEAFVVKGSLVTLLLGKGNNAGDAYVAGCYLLKKGFRVEGIAVYEEDQWGSLCLQQAKRFVKAGGKIQSLAKLESFPEEGVLVDALVGTGFKGSAKEELAKAIDLANDSSLPIIAVDIPSGLCATTGQVGSVAILATATIYLEFPKIGFFLEKGWTHVGALWKETFGLPASYQEQVKAEAFLVEETFGKDLLPEVHRTRNKYSAGQVVVVGGSPSMPGAGALSSYAALRAGAGIVKWFHLGAEEQHANVPLEVISSSLEEGWDLFFAEKKRIDALLVGPGLGRDEKAFEGIKKSLSCGDLPAVIDADALFLLSKEPSFSLPKDSILTPHTGELKKLLDANNLKSSFLSDCLSFAEKKKVHLLVKGAPNFLFSPGGIPYILPFGNPGMATAGSGDVLAGVIAALLAQKVDPKDAAILGCLLHGISGDLAAQDKTPNCLIASDIIDYLPKAFFRVQSF